MEHYYDMPKEPTAGPFVFLFIILPGIECFLRFMGWN